MRGAEVLVRLVRMAVGLEPMHEGLDESVLDDGVMEQVRLC